MKWFNYEEKKTFADLYGFEVPQVIYKGPGKDLNPEKLKGVLGDHLHARGHQDRGNCCKKLQQIL